MIQQEEGSVALSPEALTKVRELLVCCMEHPVESPQVAAKALALAMAVGQAQEQLWEEQAKEEVAVALLGKELLEAFGETWNALDSIIPYLSQDQRDQLQEDVARLFEEWDRTEIETIEDLENAKLAILKKVEGWKGSFEMQKIPSDATKIDGLERFVREVLEDMFGPLIRNLPLTTKVRQESLIIRRVMEFVEQYEN